MIKTIICSVCDKPVDYQSVHYDSSTEDYVFLVRCHKKFDRCRFPVGLIKEGWQITEARAFRDKSQENNPSNEIIEGEFTEVKLLPKPSLEEVMNEPDWNHLVMLG